MAVDFTADASYTMTLGTAGADWPGLMISIIMIFSIMIFVTMTRWLLVTCCGGCSQRVLWISTAATATTPLSSGSATSEPGPAFLGDPYNLSTPHYFAGLVQSSAFCRRHFLVTDISWALPITRVPLGSPIRVPVGCLPSDSVPTEHLLADDLSSISLT